MGKHKHQGGLRDGEDKPQKIVGRRITSEWLMALLTAVIAGVGIAGYFVSRGQQAVMQGQLDEMSAEQRAWVYATFFPDAKFTERDGNYVFRVLVQYNNVGHEPAFGVTTSTDTDILPVGSNLDFRSVACEQRRKASSTPLASGTVVFPGQTTRVDAVFAMVKKAEWQKAVSTARGLIVIYGCVDYLINPQSVHHQTGIGFLVGEATADGNLKPLPSDLTSVAVGIESFPDAHLAEAD